MNERAFTAGVTREQNRRTMLTCAPSSSCSFTGGKRFRQTFVPAGRNWATVFASSRASGATNVRIVAPGLQPLSGMPREKHRGETAGVARSTQMIGPRTDTFRVRGAPIALLISDSCCCTVSPLIVSGQRFLRLALQAQKLDNHLPLKLPLRISERQGPWPSGVTKKQHGPYAPIQQCAALLQGQSLRLRTNTVFPKRVPQRDLQHDNSLCLVHPFVAITWMHMIVPPAKPAKAAANAAAPADFVVGQNSDIHLTRLTKHKTQHEPKVLGRWAHE